MKIACIIHSLSGGGAERVMAGLASRLALRDHRVTLITLDDGGTDRYQVDAAVERRCLDVMGVHRHLLVRYLRSRVRIGAVRRAIVDTAPEVVLAFCDRTNLLALMAARSLGVPVVVSERSDPAAQQLGWYWERARARHYRDAAAVITLTAGAADGLRRKIDRDIVVIPSAIDPPPIRSDRSIAVANQRIVAMGRLEREKGFDRLISAMADLVIRAPEATAGWNLRIIGDGSLRGELESQIQSSGLADRVSMPGWVRPVWDELAGATFFVLPSRYEGFPSALGEAMATGVPALAVDCHSGPRAMINDGVNGMLVANDVSGLTAGILQMIGRTDQRERWGVAGRAIADQFSWERMVNSYEQVLQRAARKSSNSQNSAMGTDGGQVAG